MPQRALKLKQAGAVLKLPPKELQNLVQFGVVKPRRIEGKYLFDKETLLTAKIAFCLKDSLRIRGNVLARLIDVFRASEKDLRQNNADYIVFTCQTCRDEEPIKLTVPLRSFKEQIDQSLSRAVLYKDMPRGRKRAGWKKEFLKTISEAAKDLGEVSEMEIQRTIRNYREKRRVPEVTIAIGYDKKWRLLVNDSQEKLHGNAGIGRKKQSGKGRRF